MPAWRPEFSVGIARFDDEHRHLISLLNRLHSAIGSPDCKAILGPVLKELLWYTRSHFKAEELLMKRHNYPELASHKEQHNRFTEQVAQYVAHFQSGSEIIAIEVADALQDWLTEHILRSDAKYRRFFETLDLTDDPQSSPIEVVTPDRPQKTSVTSGQ